MTEQTAQAAHQTDKRELQGQVALITGAARGIGRATAVILARRGADVAALDIAAPIAGNAQDTGTPADLAETVALVEQQGRRCLSLQVDVRDAAAVDQAVARTTSELGRLDVLVANAGIAVHKPLADMTDEQWQLVLDVNLLGAVKPLRAAIPALTNSGRGRVVIVSSVGGRGGTPGVVSYAASKWALIGLTKTAALELGPQGITVNVVCPTAVDTPLFRSDEQYRDMVPDAYTQDLSFDEREARVKELTSTQVHALPIPWVQPEDIAYAIDFLVSDRARYITGEVLDVAAGSNARHMA